MLLAIDTSGVYSYASVLKDEKIYSLKGSGGRSHNEEIDELIRALLEKSAGSAAQISEIVVGAGPGSFTGLRIGYAYAKGLALALKAGLSHISTLRAAVYGYLDTVPRGTLCIIASAGRSEYFSYFARIEGREVAELAAPAIATPDELRAAADQYGGEINLINLGESTEGLDCFARILEAPDLGHALILAHRASGAAKGDDSFSLSKLADIEPLYLRDVAAKSLADRGIRLKYC